MTNLVAKKIGMTHLHNVNGTSIPLTLIKVYDNCIVEIKDNPSKSYNNITLGYIKADNTKNIKKPIVGIFKKKSLPVYKKIYSCKIDKSTPYKIGESIKFSNIIKEGDKVNVTGRSVGKGFAGVMKRHHFSGLEASHGVSVSHRSHGSTGQCQDPGKVFKGKKMAGQMGNKNVTVKNLEVVYMDISNNIIALKGSVPGFSTNDIIIKIN